MSSPSSGPRPVGPPPPPGKEGPPSGATIGSDPGAGPPRGTWHQAGYQGGPGAPPYRPAMRVYSWSSSGRSFPWFAILLLVLGVGLLIELLVPDLSFASLFILAAGAAFGAAWLLGHIVGATMPALVLTAWGLADIGADLGILSGDGWTTLAIGLAFLAGWGLGRFQGARREWALVVGSVLGLIGLADVSDSLPFDFDMVVVIPLAMIAIGVYLIVRDRLPAPR